MTTTGQPALTADVVKIGLGDEEFVAIPAGSFQMGATSIYSSEAPVHTVAVSAFLLQWTKVTQGQWRAVMGAIPSHFSSCGDTCQVENVSWDDVQKFLARLNAATGRRYRLPAEAEWEYAARAGTTEDDGGTGTLADMGWCNANAGGRTHPVAQQRPNAWGLFDLHGNVWEWVQDWCGDYPRAAGRDPTGPTG